MTHHFEFARPGIGRLTLDNPPANQLDRPDFLELPDLQAILDTPDLKALVIQGQGRNFCSGADLESLAAQRQAPHGLKAGLDTAKQLLKMIDFAPVPVLALIRGACLGAGLELALACHFRFAAPRALLGFPEVQHGLVPAMGGPLRAARLCQTGALAALLLQGRCILAEEARELGLVDQVQANDTLETAALDWLEGLVGRRSPKLVRAIMESLADGRRLGPEAALKRESARFFDLIQEADLSSAD